MDAQAGRRAAGTAARGLAVAAVALAAGIPLLVITVVSLALIPAAGVGLVLAPVALLSVRALADQQRTWAADWTGVEIARPYRPEPAGRSPWRRAAWVLGDPATWRDVLWLLVNIPVGFVLGLVPGACLVYGLEGIAVAPWLARISGYGWGPFWPLADYGISGTAATLVLAALLVLAGLPLAPALLRAHARFSRSLLAPTRDALERRVAHLATTREEAVDASAAELRRIERDLHDGAQARLVALSMNIGLAEELMRRDPETAARLLAEARQASGTALTELRDLVRGIHPPVLAERGLDGGVRALALSLPIPVDVSVELPGRPDAPVESAGYFAVAEALANVVKHSGAARAWVELDHDGRRLRAIVGDDGTGGAAVTPGGGLAGVERRLAAFDGTMAVTSPPGGPTIVTLELPCALSSPRTSPSSGTG
ncbi:Sensor histidine kinase DesK [Actinomadura rubteroloni]|uniref:histidine kinase n=1 Tax=Actinomadura rubteroloni TaxID=1926885 RepID=A0A2P4URX6_9ACTN|nr:sensor histidine kinase [Actinomadura rubteroloni]POM27803.1 Sensor histidine kinase DesK [Actinomadura rubteroloni]